MFMTIITGLDFICCFFSSIANVLDFNMRLCNTKIMFF